MQGESPQPEAAPSAVPIWKRRWFPTIIGILTCLLLAGGLLLPALSRSVPSLSPPPAPLAAVYSGDSSELGQTVILPTLDTPAPKGKNLIWCSSFQVAWSRLKNDVIKAPVRVANAEAVAERLNLAMQSDADLPTGAYYANAGWSNEGVVQTIQQEMAKRFPSVPKPTFDQKDSAIIAYAYLAANVKFNIPFVQNRKTLLFTDSAGNKTPIRSFGLREEDNGAYPELRAQVSVVHYLSPPSGPDHEDTHRPREFVIDPCRDSTPNQLLLAWIPQKETLAETLKDLKTKTEGHDFGPGDRLLIPDILFDVTHRFRELEGSDKTLLNPGFGGLGIAEALQKIQFNLDRSGAEMSSSAYGRVTGSHSFIFDRPFMIVMKKRGAVEPFFVMWVDNAELLCRP